MTVEGFVLFEARTDQAPAVERAVPPLDTPAFASGLLNDVKLMFLYPAGAPISVGYLESQKAVCRYATDKQQTVDIVSLPNGGAEIRLYDDTMALNRIVSGSFAEPDGDETGHPQRLKLTAPGWAGYELTMQLIEAVPLDEQR
jgi:hypothetical protein